MEAGSGAFMTQTVLAPAPASGDQAKHDGLARVEATHPTPVRELRAAAIDHAIRFGSVHIDEIRAIAAARGYNVATHVWGAIFKGRGWVKLGTRKSSVASNHAHESPVWGWRG